MSSTAANSDRSRPHRGRSLGTVTTYDRTAGLLIALLILFGLAVAVMLFVWFAGKFAPAPSPTIPVVLHEGSGGDPTSSSTDGLFLDAPTIEEITREAPIPLANFQETLVAVDQLVKSPNLDLLPLLPVDPTRTPSPSSGTGDEAAMGEGAGSGGVPREQRWELHYGSGDSLETYARQLDFFGIELAAVAAEGVVYVRNLSSSSPTVDRNRGVSEQRFYLLWRADSPRREVDRKLLERAGVETLGRTLVQFLPAELETKMRMLEFDYAKRPPATIRKTRFAIRTSGPGFEMFVEAQTAD